MERHKHPPKRAVGVGRGAADVPTYVLRTPGRRRVMAAARRLATTLSGWNAALPGRRARTRELELPARIAPRRSAAPGAHRPSAWSTPPRTTNLARWLWSLAVVGASFTAACLIIATRIEHVLATPALCTTQDRLPLAEWRAEGEPEPATITTFVSESTAALIAIGAPARIRFDHPRRADEEGDLKARVTSVGGTFSLRSRAEALGVRPVRVELQLQTGLVDAALSARAGTPVTAYIDLRKPWPLGRLLEAARPWLGPSRSKHGDQRASVLSARWLSPSSGMRLR